jgi:catechol 2,3-dioxygenase-like lactoylglutathione lyase family enzyme
LIDFLHSTSIFVRDVDAAIDHYVNTLGFELTSDVPMGEGERWVTVRPPGSVAALALQPARPQPPAGQFNSGITWIARDLDATYQALAAKGVSFDGPPQTMPWGAKATWFTDPDGNNYFITDTP